MDGAVREQAIALYTTIADNVDELTFNKGDILNICERDTSYDGWWECEINGSVGLVPENRLRMIRTERALRVAPKIARNPSEYYDAPISPGAGLPRKTLSSQDYEYSVPTNVELNGVRIGFETGQQINCDGTGEDYYDLPSVITVIDTQPDQKKKMEKQFSIDSYSVPNNIEKSESSQGRISSLTESMQSMGSVRSRCSSTSSGHADYSLNRANAVESLISLEDTFLKHTNTLLEPIQPNWRKTPCLSKLIHSLQHNSNNTRLSLIALQKQFQAIYKTVCRAHATSPTKKRLGGSLYKFLKILRQDVNALTLAIAELDRKGWSLEVLARDTSTVTSAYSLISSLDKVDALDTIILTSRATLNDVAECMKWFLQHASQLFHGYQPALVETVETVLEAEVSHTNMTEIMKTRPLPATPAPAHGSVADIMERLAPKSTAKSRGSMGSSSGSVGKSSRANSEKSSSSGFDDYEEIPLASDPENDLYTEIDPSQICSTSRSSSIELPISSKLRPPPLLLQYTAIVLQEHFTPVSNAADLSVSVELGPAKLVDLMKPVIVEAHNALRIGDGWAKGDDEAGKEFERVRELSAAVGRRLNFVVALLKKFTVEYQVAAEAGWDSVYRREVCIDEAIIENVGIIATCGKELLSIVQ